MIIDCVDDFVKNNETFTLFHLGMVKEVGSIYSSIMLILLGERNYSSGFLKICQKQKLIHFFYLVGTLVLFLLNMMARSALTSMRKA